MKKNSIVLIITLLISLTLVSCISLPSTQKGAKQNTSDNKVTDNNSNEEKKVNEENKNTKSYYGSWKIDRYVQINTKKKLSSSEINSHIGTIFTISEDSIKVSISPKDESSSMASPKFEEKDMSNDDLKSTWNIEFNNLGINSNSVNSINVITVSNYDIPNNNDLKIGSNIIITPNKRAYTIIDGSFYELKKMITSN